jgi:hypothetical protein
MRVYGQTEIQKDLTDALIAAPLEYQGCSNSLLAAKKSLRAAS